MEMITEPFRITLHGYSDSIADHDIPTTGKRLMCQLWHDIQKQSIRSTGINYWVYLPGDRLLTAVEMVSNAPALPFERLDVQLDRYIKHHHVGLYSNLPQVWNRLMHEMRLNRLSPKLPSLEVYGHHDPDPEKCETDVLIGFAHVA